MCAFTEAEEAGLAAELWQFAAVLAAFFVAAVVWLCVIYLPARTMEHSEGRRIAERDRDLPNSTG